METRHSNATRDADCGGCFGLCCWSRGPLCTVPIIPFLATCCAGSGFYLLNTGALCRNLFNDPEQLRRLLAPESVSTMIQMTQAAEQMQRALGLGSTGEQPGEPL